MKKFTLSVLFAIATFITNAQAPNWLWAKGVSSNSCAINSIAVDATGNSYVAGSFDSPTIALGTTTLTSFGGTNFFVAKYDAAGTVLWAKSGGGTVFDFPNSIAVDGSGNSYVTGAFFSPSITVGTTTLTNNGVYDIFVAKYNSSGVVQWAKSAGGNGDDTPNCIAVDGSGNSYITGRFASPNITIGTNTLTNAGVSDIFIAKYDPSGTVLWAKREGANNSEIGGGIAVDASGNSYITGVFQSTSLTLGTNTITNTGVYDIFVAKYDPAGTNIWAKGGGGIGNDNVQTITIDASGNSYITGWFGSSTMVMGTVNISNGNSFTDCYIAKFDNTGTALWAKSAGGSNNDGGNGIVVDGSGNSYVTGSFESATIAFGTTTLTSSGSSDVFIAKYDPTGSVLWAKSVGGSGNDYGNDIGVDASGTAYAVGYFQSTSIAFGTYTLTGTGANQLFIAKLNNATGIEELQDQNSVSIYPNPSSEKTTFKSEKFLKDATLTICNSSGQIIKQVKNITGNTITLFRDDLPGGLYFLRLTEDNSLISTAKLVIAD